MSRKIIFYQDIMFLLLLFCARGYSQLLINTTHPCHEVDNDFLSVTIDISGFRTNFSSALNLDSTLLFDLAKNLSPVTVRVGGTEGDFMIFTDFNPINGSSKTLITHSDHTLTEQDFDNLLHFVTTAEWQLIFGLNQLIRFPNNQWDYSNAELLIDYCMQKGYRVAWELGNEPDCYAEDSFTSVLTGTQGAEGFKVLRELLNSKNYPVTLIAGPDVAVLTRRDYLIEYLSAIGASTINATTWHHYYGNSQTMHLEDFYSVKRLDQLIDDINLLMQICNNSSFTGDLWLGETSTAYGGGSELLSSSFVSGFMWLDKLGLAAYTHKKVFRQDFAGSKYSLIDSEAIPYPDYWLSLLYKKLVGVKVLNVSGALEHGRGIRLYAHCARRPTYPAGSVIILALNVYNETNTVNLLNSELVNSSQDIYWLSPYPKYNLTSRIVTLNSKPLLIEDTGAIPPLKPVTIGPSKFVHVHYLSFGFIVFKEANFKACM